MTVEVGITLSAKQLQYSEAWLFWPQSWWGFSWWCWTSNYWEMWQKMDKNGRRLGSFQLVKQLLQKVKPKPLLKLWLALETAQLSARLILIGQLRHSICWSLDPRTFYWTFKLDIVWFEEKISAFFPPHFFASNVLKMSIHIFLFFPRLLSE